MCCLKNMFWYAVILAHALSSVKGTVKTIKTPLVLSKCITQNMTAQHSCIRKLLTNETNIQLQITEEFYWHPTKRIRRECRVIPDEERSALFDAINALKNDTVSLSFNRYFLLMFLSFFLTCQQMVLCFFLTKTNNKAGEKKFLF